MGTVVCKRCQRTSSVTPSTRKIRCHGCGDIISVGDTGGSVSSSRVCKSTNQDPRCIVIEGKGFRSFYRKLSSNIVCPRNTPSFNFCPSVRISDKPPRGKRAFLCGVSYKNKKFRLRGTTQDVMNMGNLLIKKFGFPVDSILILSEDGPYELPTKRNILRAFEWLVKGSQKGDSFVFCFSGHGFRQLEFEGDEMDGFDEAICPLDFESEGLILDNDINEMIVRPLEEGVKLHAIIDSCHSGTILDLPKVFDRHRLIWNDNSPPSGSYKGTKGGTAICFSACEDHQQAADTSAFSAEKTMAGAMAHNFVKAITDIRNVTYLGILNFMHEAIEEANNQYQGHCVGGGMLRMFHRKMLQDPLLSSSEPFDVHSVFKL
ncbi:OLC1v1002655C1 [Oldenlandia corymbosa var. corymbosa]|uniref:OLC1v1002655C1 n=1 Tax=Oldenlandia corymbosa var. corymbosa TaxID=529605 RepID=A0AAV1D8T0_OLDCO|nr:OLC1v1002655C1 [Oldenlandia corymbosa var. corymbosa]